MSVVSPVFYTVVTVSWSQRFIGTNSEHQNKTLNSCVVDSFRGSRTRNKGYWGPWT